MIFYLFHNLLLLTSRLPFSYSTISLPKAQHSPTFCLLATQSPANTNLLSDEIKGYLLISDAFGLQYSQRYTVINSGLSPLSARVSIQILKRDQEVSRIFWFVFFMNRFLLYKNLNFFISGCSMIGLSNLIELNFERNRLTTFFRLSYPK